MRNHFRNSLIIYLGLTLFFLSCEYEPSEKKFTKVKEPETPQAFFSLSLDEDTIRITRSATLNFGFLCENHTIYDIEFLIDDLTIYKESGEEIIEDQFSINSGNITDGYHKLTMNAFVNTKSGSMREKLGAEAFQMSKEWVIYYQKDPTLITPKFTFLGIVDGRLRIEWEKVDSTLFDGYSVERGIFDQNWNEYIYDQVAFIKNSTENYFIDNEYLAGNIKYRISYAAGGFQFISEYATAFFTSPTPGFQISTDSKLNRKLSWNKPLLYNNFGKITIYLNWSELKVITDVNDTTFICKDGLLPVQDYTFIISPNLPDGWVSHLNVTYVINYEGVTEEFLPTSHLCFTGVSPNSIYGTDENNIYKYSPADGTSLSSTQTNSLLQVSLNDKYLYSGTFKYNTENLNSEMLNIAGDMGFTGSFTSMSISNNAFFVGKTNYFNEIAVYDLENNKPIQHITSKSLIYNPVISPNGDYIVFLGDFNPRIEIWKFNPDSAKYLEEFYQSGDYGNQGDYPNITFLPETNESKFYIVNGNTIELWSCENNQIIKVINASVDKVIQVDPVSKNLIAIKNGNLLVLDANDYSILWEVALPTNQINLNGWHPGELVVVNSVIYSKSLKLDLKNYETLN